MIRIAIALWLLADAAGAEILRVYTKPIEPFAFQKEGKDQGFSLDLWERVAKQAGFEYQLTWVKTMPELMEALKSGRADVGVAAISITSDREKVIDFSQPYYESGLQILVEGGTAGSSSAAVIGTLFNWSFAKLLLVIVFALLVSSHLLWWFEHRSNEGDFPADYKHGVWESLWWTSSVLITGGCENKAPAGVGGRLVAVIWMLTGILLVSVLTASVTSAMTVRQLTSEINGPSDLAGHLTATITGTTAEKFLADRHLELRSFPSLDDAIAALSAKKVQAVVYDAPVLLYRAAKGSGGQSRVVGRLFEKQNYGIALQPGSKYRKRINQVLLKLGEGGYLAELRKKYFGDGD
jgi:polar amino acid transport system substrate-binding protein